MPRAGLTSAIVADAGAALADEMGPDHLRMGLLADRLGVKTPSLYKHVPGAADLAHCIAAQAMTELADVIRDGTAGRAGGRDALTAAAHAIRGYVQDHPGRYAIGNNARPSGPDDPLIPALNRVLASLTAVLRGYEFDPGQEIHALRMLRSAVHGFADLEAADGFQMNTDIGDSFAWMIKLMTTACEAKDSSTVRPLHYLPEPEWDGSARPAPGSATETLCVLAYRRKRDRGVRLAR